MKLVKAIAILFSVVMVAMLIGATARAQQSSFAEAQPTPGPLLNPNCCSDAPASPPPPGFDRHPGDWANVRKMSEAHGDRGCMLLCGFAEELWRRKKAGQINQPNTAPSPSDQPQGLFPLPGGASGYILPAQSCVWRIVDFGRTGSRSADLLTAERELKSRSE